MASISHITRARPDKGTFNRTFPGAATSDSDIFILNVDEFLKGKAKPKNLTNNPQMVDEDPDWSPDGKTIVYTRYGVNESHEDPITAEVYEINADGKGKPKRLTLNTEEDRAPAWSPDGKRIAFMCKNGGKEFLVCVMNAKGSGIKALTTKESLTVSWTPDGTKIIFHRSVGAELGGNEFQFFSVDLTGAGETQMTFGPDLNGFPNPGRVRKKRQ